MDRSIKENILFYKCITANTSAILQYAAHTADQLKILLFSVLFHSIHPCSVNEVLGRVLKFATAAAHKIDVVGES